MTKKATGPTAPLCHLAGAEPGRRGARLGVRMRGQLADAYASRGHHKSSLWYVYSPKAKADFVLRSDLEFGHFLLAESDPEVAAVDYAPAKRVATLAGEGIGTIVDAEVTKRSGVVEWREVKRSEDVAHGAKTRANLQILIQIKAAGLVAAHHEVFTEREIFLSPQRIHNWMRIIPWLAQARDWPLYDFSIEVAALLNARGEVRFDEVLSLGDGQNNALYGAALLHAVQNGAFQSDLNELPFSQRSRFYLERARS